MPGSPLTAIELKNAQTIFDVRLAATNWEISPDTILGVLKLCMEVVEMTSMKGTAKRDVVIGMVRGAVVNAPRSDEVETILLEMIDDGILSHMIDVIVAASRGELHINGLKKSGGILASTLVPLLRRLLCPCRKKSKKEEPEVVIG